MDAAVKRLLRHLAAKYETTDFLNGDPSWFMHRVEGAANREATAFVASCLSFGSRKQFLPKIQCILDCAKGDVDGWIRKGLFERDFVCGCGDCFYRFFTHGHMYGFFRAYRRLLEECGTLGEYVKSAASGDGYAAVAAICRYFADAGADAVVPKNAQSACKRVCMFLRWMVRSGSPVDLGLWADFIDRRSLVMPLDTHVVQQSVRLGLMKNATASMSAARRLSRTLLEVFPDDPLKGDFALFGYGVNAS
jgi:uncharacterized protein (TIGR02757 family)